MKKLLPIITCFAWLNCPLFAQNPFNSGFLSNSDSSYSPTPTPLDFSIQGKYIRPVKKDDILHAQKLSDFVSGYPKNWIEKYDSVTISAVCNGIRKSTKSVNDQLTAEQKSMLASADLMTDIDINVHYTSTNAATNEKVNMEINSTAQLLSVTMTVIPHIEATYPTGRNQLNAYIKEKVIRKIPESVANQIKVAEVFFTVDESGNITNIKLSKSSGDKQSDQLLIDAVHQMPKWNTARNEKGMPVKEEFKFIVSKGGC